MVALVGYLVFLVDERVYTNKVNKYNVVRLLVELVEYSHHRTTMVHVVLYRYEHVLDRMVDRLQPVKCRRKDF